MCAALGENANSALACSVQVHLDSSLCPTSGGPSSSKHPRGSSQFLPLELTENLLVTGNGWWFRQCQVELTGPGHFVSLVYGNLTYLRASETPQCQKGKMSYICPAELDHLGASEGRKVIIEVCSALLIGQRTFSLIISYYGQGH